ncbi:hypothetical protein DUT91_09555 [Phyllobacterium salinisoli]|uniref:Uncharacterized protein n=1 Tax=Phyllobacterium salinisoli TaxID=1899321 RepID=A0A368K540_9HYPH|nr:hypothetical protein [Phyllobacterium salinisoli]RCS24499.1 hypothetical protein DUT91_09555 [Phyllobacterium salinisoli]
MAAFTIPLSPLRLSWVHWQSGKIGASVRAVVLVIAARRDLLVGVEFKRNIDGFAASKVFSGAEAKALLHNSATF